MDLNKELIIKLDEKEVEASNKFYEKHKSCPQLLLGKSWFSTEGGLLTFEITPTGLGDVIVIRCNACGKKENITNVENF